MDRETFSCVSIYKRLATYITFLTVCVHFSLIRYAVASNLTRYATHEDTNRNAFQIFCVQFSSCRHRIFAFFPLFV